MISKMSPSTDETKVRAELSKAIRKHVRDDIWNHLVKQRWVNDYLTSECGLQDLVREYESLDDDFALRVQRGQTAIRREIPPDSSTLALSEIFAMEARLFPEVVSFRQEFLQGEFLSEKAVPAWIAMQAKKEETPTLILQVPLPSGAKRSDWRSILPTLPEDWPVRSRAEFLAYSAPHDENASFVPVCMDGVTGRLKRVAGILTEHFQWQEAQAVAFVLSDVTPLCTLGTANVVLSSHIPPRIQLEVSAQLQNHRVASLYSQVCGEVLGNGKKGRKRSISEKHARLAVFLAQNTQTPDGWEKRMRKWNRTQRVRNEEWSYQSWRQFARDAKVAFLRVTGREWQPSGKDSEAGFIRVTDGEG